MNLKKRKSFRCIWISTNHILEKNALIELNIMNSNKNEIPDFVEFYKMRDRNNNNSSLISYTTYSSLARESNYTKLINWLKKSDENLIVFDEAHSVKNRLTLSGKMAVRLQEELKNPCVIYSTATAASEIRQLHYMTKLGLWDDYFDFVRKFEKYGSTSMELIALQLKSQGRLVSRHLGLKNIEIRMKQCNLNEDEIHYYNLLSEKWRCQNIDFCTNLDGLIFYRNVISNFKVRHLISIIEESLDKNESVVIGIQSTGEVAQKRNEFSLLKDKLIQRNINVDDINFELNHIDTIVNYFGSDKVAEISGRKSRIIENRNGKLTYVNIPEPTKEIAAFQNNVKPIIILTKAGSSGISLHSTSNNLTNNSTISVRKRHHIILETPWSAENLLQQIGRTHRTNSDIPPYYTILISNVPAEFRFFNGLSKKFENLGAITKGDKRATIFEGLSFHGCDMLLDNNFIHFHLEFNLQIGRKWYRDRIADFSEVLKLKNISNVKRGLHLYIQSVRCSTDDKLKTILNNLLKKLNLKSVNYLNEGIHNSDDVFYSVNLSCRSWKDIWKNVAETYDLIYLLTNDNIFMLYTCCWQYIRSYIKDAKFWFDELKDWKEEYKYSGQIPSKLKILLLCKNRPECANNLGTLPEHLILEIVSWSFNRNDLSNLDWRKMYKDEKIDISKQILANNYTVFFNNLFNFPFQYQKYIFDCLFENSNDVRNTKRNNISTIEEYLLKNKSNLKIHYESLYEDGDFFHIYINIKNKYNIEEYESQYNDWFVNERILTFIQNKNNKRKYGILLKSSHAKWDFEIWYPSENKPSLCFTKFQWEIQKEKYNFLNIDKEKWLGTVKENLNQITQKYNRKKIILKVATTNILNYWNVSIRKLIQFSLSSENKCFIGLVCYKSEK